ncbi:MAC/perforin domain-containing protein [Luteimonas aquatica]|uniref:MAC/perforin domain-containing protein n=1 Tax=Luteimonas aquatica TaxID=450364 RepID=UPI001F57E7AC|nr:MAC/perforin domain-containing protein [Luteimonas aquatica]
MSESTLTRVVVRRSDFKSKAFKLDTGASLAEARAALQAAGFMSEEDCFLCESETVSVDRDQEAGMLLEEVLKDGELRIGQALPDVPSEVHLQFPSLPADKQKRIYANAEIFRGFVIRDEGFAKGTQNVYVFAPGYLPLASRPEKNTEFVSGFAFSKAMIETRETATRSTKLELSTPFLSAESEFSKTREHTTTSTKTEEFLLAKLIFSYADVAIDPAQLEVNPRFVAELADVLDGLEYRNFHGLIRSLERWGYYIPCRFALGGAVIGREQTQVDEYTEAENESKEFSASFKLDIKGYGGGASHTRKDEKGRTDTHETKYVNIQKQMRGGSPNLESNLDDWVASLKDPATWVIADVQDFWPTLELLRLDEGDGNRLLGRALRLLDKFAGWPEAHKLVRYLDLRAYASRIQGSINPFD